MPPGGKPPQGVGGNPQRQHPGNHQGGDGKRHRAHAAGAEIGNHQEGAEENQGGAKVIHQRQTAANQHGIGNEGNQIPLVHDSVHGGCTGKHKADLAQFRRLEGQPANVNPAFGTVVLCAEGQGQQQKAQSCRHGQIPHPLGPLQIPQGPAHQQIHQNAKNQGKQLLDGGSGGNSGNGCHAQGTKEKGDGLHFKGAAANEQIEEIQPPFHHHDACKAGHHQRRIGHGIVEGKSKQRQQLESTQKQQIQRPGNGAGGFGAQPGLQLGLLPGDEL